MLRTTLLAGLAVLALNSCTSVKNSGGQAVTPYPLNECLVTDNELGSMGDPIVIVHEGQEVKFCCEPCVDEFYEDPQAFLSKLKQD